MEFPTVESALALCYTVHHEQVLTVEILKVKAQEFAGRMSINDFQASPGWVTNFKKRHNLSQFARQVKPSGRSATFP